jgi:hypothetical protein
MTFALVAFLTFAGQVHAYVLDTGLTYADCHAAVDAGALSADLPHALRVNLDGAPLVCELER